MLFMLCLYFTSPSHKPEATRYACCLGLTGSLVQTKYYFVILCLYFTSPSHKLGGRFRDAPIINIAILYLKIVHHKELHSRRHLFAVLLLAVFPHKLLVPLSSENHLPVHSVYSQHHLDSLA